MAHQNIRPQESVQRLDQRTLQRRLLTRRRLFNVASEQIDLVGCGYRHDIH
jgi:hypothetical protein